MTTKPMLKEPPCGACDHGSGECWCDAMEQAWEIAEIAGQVAALIATVGDPKMRKEIAESAADGFANALYVQGAGARLDDAVFYAACNVHREKVAA